MAIFLTEDVAKLLWNKFVVVIGDSVQRGIYKDLVSILQTNSYLSEKKLKTKGEMSFMDDVLIEGGKKEEMNNGTNYKEVRQFKTDYHLVRFYFVTRVHNKYMESIFRDLAKEPRPDVVLMNSCLWDISRYGHTGMAQYKVRLERTLCCMRQVLPADCLFVWNTALPVAGRIRGGFLPPELQHLAETLRLDVLEANFYARELAAAANFDVLDLNFFFRGQLQRRAGDGVHWNREAHRRMTNLILAHVAEAWGLGVPRRLCPQPRQPREGCSAQPSAAAGDFHRDISLSAPGQLSKARRQPADDWGDLPQFIDFDRVASPKTEAAGDVRAGQECDRRSKADLGSCGPGAAAGQSGAAPSRGGPVRSGAPHRRAQRYAPYNGPSREWAGAREGGWREDQHAQAGHQWRSKPLWRELEERRRQRAQWERGQELRQYGVQY